MKVEIVIKTTLKSNCIENLCRNKNWKKFKNYDTKFVITFYRKVEYNLFVGLKLW